MIKRLLLTVTCLINESLVRIDALSRETARIGNDIFVKEVALDEPVWGSWGNEVLIIDLAAFWGIDTNEVATSHIFLYRLS